MLTIYGDSISGNCLKVKWTADHLRIAYRWVETSVVDGETRVPDFLAINPAGQVPVVVLPDNRTLAQSNAIILYLAERSALIPKSAYQRAKMTEWLFWEQYSHEPYIAVARFQVRYLGTAVADLDPKLVERGIAALDRLEAAVSEADYLVGSQLTLADLSLIAYTRTAGEGGFDLTAFPAVNAWIARVERDLGIAG
jgi:glutathione S-transferase